MRTDFTLNDSTGSIRIAFYHKEPECDPRGLADFRYKPGKGQWIKLFGTFRLYREEHVIIGIQIQEITSHNEIIMHMMRTFLAHNERLKGPLTTKLA